jgi:perosamine synthetase
MINLLPTEYWDYSVKDIMRGLGAAARSTKAIEPLSIAGLGVCIPIRSARAAIVAAIKALDLRSYSRIAVPLYCCPIVFKAIEASGCQTRFIDIEPGTYCISAEDLFAKRSEFDAVVAVHMFGHLCDMSRLKDVAQNKPIIEDCAQSLGSKLDGRMSGSFGTIAAFSFRSGKYLSVGEGGALYSSDTSIRARISDIVSDMPVPGLRNDSMHVLKTYMRSKLRSKPLWGLVGHWLWRLYNSNVKYSDKSPLILGQIYNSDMDLVKKRLNDLQISIERQRNNAALYSQTLALDDDMLSSEKPNTFYNRYLYPITMPSQEQRDLIADYLQTRQVGTSKPYQDATEIATRYYGYKGDCPVAENLSKRVLVIPNNASLKQSDVQRISKCVNEGWEIIKKK